MIELFDADSDAEINIGINNDYAKHYDSWRQKEVLQKLKDRYGDGAALGKVDNDSSSSEEEDEDANELTQEIEKDFFKTLSYLKKKDPCIYDKNVKFFKENDATKLTEETKTTRKKGEKPLFLRDYERKLIVERSGKLSDDDEEQIRPASESRSMVRPSSPTLVEEQNAIKDSFKAVLQDSDGEENAWGGLFESRKKTSDELEQENDGYYEWLKGQQDDITDKNIKSDLKHLHDYWNDPKLDSNEIFLKDYILNKKFLESEDKDRVPTYDEIVHDSDGLSEDETTVAKQEEFEHKYNFRFEEPDQEFIKRYPRTMENSLRRKDTRRKEKREEIKERKVAKKERKKEELKQLKSLKRKEIMEKIEKLKQITGNANVGFQDEDLEGDFDPAEYDKRMSQLFTDEFYGEEDNDKKPQFPDIDEELELEDWNNWEAQDKNKSANSKNYEPHCDDPNFNMDCDFNPSAQFQSEVIESTKRKKKGKKSKFAQALAKQKPIFNPNDHTFDEYLDEYYAMDFEDVIGDLPCRFKYRSVVPNDFGLTIDEILKADDKELNQWYSLKKAVQIRPEYAERKDLEKYRKKATNIEYKRKILTSLYNEPEEEQQSESKKKKKKKKTTQVKTEKDAVVKSKTIVPVSDFQDKAPKLTENGNLFNDMPKKKSKKSKKEHRDNMCVEYRYAKPREIEEQATSSKSIVQNCTSPSVDQQVSKKRKNHDLNEVSNSAQPCKKRKEMASCSIGLDDTINEVSKKKKKINMHSELKQSVHNAKNNNSGEKEKNICVQITRRQKKNMKNKKISPSSEEAPLLVKKTKVKTLNQMKEKKSIEEPIPFSDSRLKAYGLHPKKFKNYLKYGKTEK